MTFQVTFLCQYGYGVSDILHRDQTDLKKNAFLTLREAGHTFDEIRRALGCSERTLYRWQSEDEDNQFQNEVQSSAEVSEREQQLQNQVNELSEHIDRLSNSYSNLWNQVHQKQDNVETAQERAYRIYFEIQLKNDRKRQAILSKYLQRTHVVDDYLVKREGRPSKPDVPTDLYWAEHMEQLKKWNKEFDNRNKAKKELRFLPDY